MYAEFGGEVDELGLNLGKKREDFVSAVCFFAVLVSV